MTNTPFIKSALFMLLLSLSSSLQAESSMTVIDESTPVDEVINAIPLPPPATSSQKPENASNRNGRETRDQARSATNEALRARPDREPDEGPDFREDSQQQGSPATDSLPEETGKPTGHQVVPDRPATAQ
ncbi:hypothetical protein [Marinospirillum perlucidum]|uniref:hypothetical protein n=1 Tax=Marinospirillum perlucidum TaxID=1982602 RepID=UPI00138FCF16|nr:hypothetical protein [Marinospirillum perlucidum]